MSLPRRFVLAAGLAAALAPPALATSAREIDGDVTEALERLTRTNETAANISKKARAVLVFPKIIKAGLVIGGKTLKPFEVEKLLATRFMALETQLDKLSELGVISVET